MSIPIALLDACTLFGFHSRDLLLSLSKMSESDADQSSQILYRPKLSHRINEEWTRSLLKVQPDLDPKKIARIVEQIVMNIPDCLVEGYEPLEATLTLPDPDDRHVLAAAIRGNADVIVTANLSDFPDEALSNYGVVAVHPDDFVLGLIESNPMLACELIRAMRLRWTKPAHSAFELIERLRRSEFPKSATLLSALVEQI